MNHRATTRALRLTTRTEMEDSVMRIRTLRRAVATAAILSAAAAAGTTAHAAGELNIYNWSDYIAPDTIPTFQKQTGLHVRYDNYDSDDTLQAKLMSGNSGYDVVVPTSNYMAKQIQASVYQPLDKSKLPNLANLDPLLMKMVADADPGNRYGVPWAYGTDGIGYNVQAVKKVLGDKAPVDSWALVFDPANMAKLKSCGVSFLDQAVDVFAATLQYMGRIRTARTRPTTAPRTRC